MSGMLGNKSLVRTFRKSRMAVGVLYSQLTSLSADGPRGNPSAATELLPAHSGKFPLEEFAAQAADPPAISVAG